MQEAHGIGVPIPMGRRGSLYPALNTEETHGRHSVGFRGDLMTGPILTAIRALLAEHGIAFREVEHAPTYTSEESAAARGEELGVGAKALLIKTDDVFRLFVLAADRKLDSSAIKRELGAKKTRFATPEELLELTGLVPGSVPPFGPPILPFELFADNDVGRRYGRVAFNAGSLTHSIILPAGEWERIAQPRRFCLAKTDAM